MKTCQHCEGELLRHGITHYSDPSIIGIRYRCRDCGKSFTERMAKDETKGLLFFNSTGRPTMKDWRHIEQHYGSIKNLNHSVNPNTV